MNQYAHIIYSHLFTYGKPSVYPSTHTKFSTIPITVAENKLTARTRKGMTSIMINVDLTPRTLKNPTDPSTESKTSTTPERPSKT